MDIAINGTIRQIDSPCSVSELITQLGLNAAGVAVAVNRAVVPRSNREQHALKPFDSVEIIYAVGGG